MKTLNVKSPYLGFFISFCPVFRQGFRQFFCRWRVFCRPNVAVLVVLAFVLVSCGDRGSLVDSLSFDACFKDYDDLSELTSTLEKLDQGAESTSFMTVRGCLNYQLGNYSEAEELLTKAYQESEQGEESQNIAAAALSFIYLKEFQKTKIKPYLKSAQQTEAGRWMLTLYHIDNYRETSNKKELQKAITQLRSKHSLEGSTSATEKFLQQMVLIGKMEDICGGDVVADEKADKSPVEGGPVASEQGGATQADSAMAGPVLAEDVTTCTRNELEEEKRYLFSTAHGLLAMFVKSPPFNSSRLRPKKPADPSALSEEVSEEEEAESTTSATSTKDE